MILVRLPQHRNYHLPVAQAYTNPNLVAQGDSTRHFFFFFFFKNVTCTSENTVIYMHNVLGVVKGI